MITLAYITARKSPRFDWLFQSIIRNGGYENLSQILIVDRFAEAYDSWSQDDVEKRKKEVTYHAEQAGAAIANAVHHVAPKPNVWSGKHRLTPRDWWSKPSDINTAYAYCKNNFIALIDDRCVLAPTCMDAILQAKQEQYAVCGTYRKHEGLVCEKGVITNEGKIIGEDGRVALAQGSRRICPGTWMYGHAIALPLEWALSVNGCDESWCSVSMEDTHFGQMLENNLYPIYHDPRFGTWQDRTSCDHDMKRSSKERWPHDTEDKTHSLIKRIWNNKQSAHPINLREIREIALLGGPFTIPTEPIADWFDGQELKEMW